MTFGGWSHLLARNRFRFDSGQIPRVVRITFFTLFHSTWKRWQWLLFGWRADRAKIVEAPVFILGHWRTGTTLLHELLVQDPRHTYPDTYACFAPNHFLLTESFARRWLRFLVPKRRPMDNMPAGWEHPQEDEFALCNMGLPSPYLTIAFPNEPPQYPEYLTLEGVPPRDLERWKRGLERFLRHVTYRTPKRIVLKSPPHTARIKVLLESFPDARFVHIVRDPFVVFSSTMHLWRRLYERHGLQKPTFEGLEELVLSTFERMYESFEARRGLISSGRFCEVRYEDLVRDPLGTVRQTYQDLSLGDFEIARPAIEKYLAAAAGYQTNRYELGPELRAKIAHRWAAYIERYGYGAESPDEPMAARQLAKISPS